MEFGRLWVLRGPNIWARMPVIEVEARPGDLTTWPIDLGNLLAGRLSKFTNHISERFPEELRRASGPAQALPHVALHLQCLAGCAVAFGATRPGPTPGQLRVAVEYEEEPLGRACLETARMLCM